MNTDIKKLAKESDSLGELIQQTEQHGDIDIDDTVDVLIQDIYNRDIPKKRVKDIVMDERKRVDRFSSISLSQQKNVARYVDIHDLEHITGEEFEYLLSDILGDIEGYAETTSLVGDQGVDVLWHKPNGTIAVQAKAYQKNNKVSNSAIQEVYAGMNHYIDDYDIVGCAVVTTSSFTDSAKEAAKTNNVKLYNRNHVKEWLDKTKMKLDTMGEIIEDI